MGLRETFRNLRPGSPSRGKCSIELQRRNLHPNHNQVASANQLTVSPDQVTEQSLQVWRALPAEIRHDPSMASFQMENERIHGSTSGISQDNDEEDDDKDDDYSENIVDNGVTFLTFVAHTLPGVILAVIQSCLYLRLFYHNIDALRLNEPKEILELRREIKVWQRAVNAIASCSKDAQLVRCTLDSKVKHLKRTLRRKQRGVGSTEVYTSTLDELKQKYPIKNRTLLWQSSGALAFVIICFFIQSVPHWRTLPLGWVALLGVILLLIILNRDDLEHLMHRIEWTTLLFFAAMFVMMECVERLGLFSCIGELTEHVILSVNERHRLAMAIFMILWTSALASSILDSIPVTAMMVKLVISLVAKESLGLPLQPLVWALTLGASLGGNGTLYGASANVIAAGIAEQHGYKLSFTRYLKTVFPMMLGQITLMTIYLMVAHIVFGWH
ncbi:P protein isoform X2 [Drosophila willistoni]|uniref:P protein isoform X2 n=1 Tax=Drosophila willistoni TaxID=7260 RepID=UPI001F076711|nr:P protein isoform X2 [Drosophila willistoni]